MKKIWIIVCSIIYLAIFSSQALPADSTEQAVPAPTAEQAIPAPTTEQAAPAPTTEQAAPATGTGPFCSNGKWGCGDDWKFSLSVPAVQVRLNEQAKIFSGLAAGIQLNNLLSRREDSFLNAIIITPAIMLSTTSISGSSRGSTHSDYVFSGAILFGFKHGNKSLQIGYAYDLINSEGAGAYHDRYRDSLLVTIGITAF
jgi:hypothetical protein